MPANLPALYFEAEKRFRATESTENKITTLEDMLSIMPKHKGTDIWAVHCGLISITPTTH